LTPFSRENGTCPGNLRIPTEILENFLDFLDRTVKNSYNRKSYQKGQNPPCFCQGYVHVSLILLLKGAYVMPSKAYSSDIVNAIKQFLDSDDWNYRFDSDKGLFRFGLNLQGPIKQVNYIIDAQEDEYVLYAISPIGAESTDANMMAKMAEFVCRANYGFKNGCFELDMSDGEIRFRSYVDCEDQIPSQQVIKNSIYCPAAMFRRYAPGITSIIFNDANPAEAVERCESDL